MAEAIDTIWDTPGTDKNYEHWRSIKSETSQELGRWIYKAYFVDGLSKYLDKNFLDNLRNEDFFGRLWELEIAENFILAGLTLLPTNGTGPDFCVELAGGHKMWIEAVLARPDEELVEIRRKALASNGQPYNTPRTEVALRYSSSLVGKAEKFSEKYGSYVEDGDFALIAVSAFPPGSMWSSIDMFMPAILPIDHMVVHFSTTDQPLDPTVARPTHEFKPEHLKKSGVAVKKTFLYPGDDFPHINGVIFSEASNLQQLLGTISGSFNDSTNRPHVFENYTSMGKLPDEFTKHFYFHRPRHNGEMLTIDQKDPEGVTTGAGEGEHE